MSSFPQKAVRTSTQKPLRWGIIGTGTRGLGAHLPALLSFADFDVLGACDVRKKFLHRAVDQIGGSKVRAYSDYQKLLANPDINAVVIATPNCFHKEMVIAALQAKKHIMCEKPMAVSYEQCKAMEIAIDRSDRTVLFTLQLRYSPRWQEMRSAIETGKIGRPRYALMAEFRGDWNRLDVWKYTDPKTGKSINWRFRHAASGGTLSEKACHHFDLLAWMLGENPKSVKCDGSIAYYTDDGRDTWDHASTILKYPSAATALHSLCMFGPSRMDLQVIGDEGAITSSDESPALTLETHGKRRKINPAPEIGHGRRGPAEGQETAVLRMYEHFMECVKHNKKPRTDVNKAIASSKTAWLGELSNQRKKEVTANEL